MPAQFSVSRTIRIAAPPTAVWPYIASLREWERWSPWERLDAGVERDYSGPQQGAGARSRWSGNRRAGRGEIEIVEAEPPRELVAVVRHERPRRTTSSTTLTLTAHDGTTEVDWAMTGEMNLATRIIARCRPLDGRVGKDFERGLQSLRRLVEEGQAGPPGS